MPIDTTKMREGGKPLIGEKIGNHPRNTLVNSSKTANGKGGARTKAVKVIKTSRKTEKLT